MRSMATPEDVLGAATADEPDAPGLVPPAEDWEHIDLYRDVFKALYALPGLFTSTLHIDGILATDLFSLSGSLGATLELHVVESLNRNRHLWDENEKYGLYRFVRQSQTFPDVLLQASAPDIEPRVIMGIELKGWYCLASESEPTFRFRTTSAVCQAQDLLVVYPWALRNVLSGEPRLFRPWVGSAPFVAQHRNWHWQYQMDHGDKDSSIVVSDVTTPYPNKSDEIADVPAHDISNFGRIARYGLMDQYMEEVKQELLVGIPVEAWQKFLKRFGEGYDRDAVMRALDRAAQTAARGDKLSPAKLEAISEHLAAIAAQVSGN